MHIQATKTRLSPAGGTRLARAILLGAFACVCCRSAPAQLGGIKFDDVSPAAVPFSRPSGGQPFTPAVNPAGAPVIGPDGIGIHGSPRFPSASYDSSSVARSSTPRNLRNIEYDLPTLWVRGDGSGGCSRSKFRLSRGGTGPLRVSASDDTPGGSAPESRASLWQAAMTAALLRNDPLTGVRVEYEYSGLNGGPSAGAVFCLAILSALDGRPFPSDFAMTGTIMPDGTVGLVGGVAHKLEGAKAAGIRRVCIPAFARFESDDDGSYVDLVARGRELGLELHLVSNVEEAYAILHGLSSAPADALPDSEVYAEAPAQEKPLFECIVRSGRQAAYSRENYEEALDDPSVAKVMESVSDLMQALFPTSDMDTALSAGMLHLALRQSSENLAAWGGLDQLARRLSDVLPQFDLSSPEGYRKWDDELQERFAQLGHQVEDIEAAWLLDPRSRGPLGALSAQCVSVNWYSEISNRKLRLQASTPAPSDRQKEKGKNGELLVHELVKEVVCARFEKFFAAENQGWQILAKTLPQREPARPVEEVEGLFFAAQKALADAMDQEFAEDRSTLVEASFDWSLYLIKRNEAAQYHAQALSLKEDGDPVAPFALMMSTMAQADTLAHGFMARTMASPEMRLNRTFLSYLLRTSRVQAVRALAECSKAQIPCPRVRFHLELGDFHRDDDEYDPFDVLREYWCAMLKAKALRLVY